MYKFNLESVFLSYFFKKRFLFADFPEATLKTCLMVDLAVGPMIPNIYKFPLTALPEKESYSGYDDDHTRVAERWDPGIR